MAKTFTVSVLYETRVNITVTAEDRDQARELAYAEMDAMDDADVAKEMFDNRDLLGTDIEEND
jgi:hypothetical protein